MDNPRIVLSGSCPSLEGLSWEADNELSIGRKGSNDIVLSDPSVADRQARIYAGSSGWAIRDLAGSEKSPSIVNGKHLCSGESRLCLHDTLQFGRLQLHVSTLRLKKATLHDAQAHQALPLPSVTGNIRTSRGFIRVQESATNSWDESLQKIITEPTYQQRHVDHLLTLLRMGQHLGNIGNLDELLETILKDAVYALSAQRGAIILANEGQVLTMRAALAPGLPPQARGLGYSRTLAQRCFAQGESLLCQNTQMEQALLNARSVQRGSMMSIVCAVVRSPRERLGILHLDRGPFQEPFAPHDLYVADAIAASAAVGIESAMLIERQREDFIASVTSLARTVEMRDQYTHDHTLRVTDYSVMLGFDLGMSPEDIHRLRIGTPLHDIGKIAVDDAILRKRGQLTPDEYEKMKLHTRDGAIILENMRSLDPMIPIIRHHHERWDGGGYPDGIGEEDIPQIARVVAVADAFDAMTSDRPYRKAMTVDRAFAELQAGAGSHFDPACVAAFLHLRPKIEARLHAPNGVIVE